MNICLTAIICTLNRAEYLRESIKSLIHQTANKRDYEILVVDNNSTDKTKEIVFKEFSHITNLRYIFEPVTGLSQARNTGWKNAKGEYIAYLDDDAIAEKQWVETILDVFNTVQPKPGCVGGKINLLWEAPRPSWLSDKITGFLGALYLSDKPVILSKEQNLFGGNSAYQKSVLEAINGFRTELGRKGDNILLSNEEILLRKEIDNQGYISYYHPRIAISHHVLQYRVRKKWFIRRAYWQGVSDEITNRQIEHKTAYSHLWNSGKLLIYLIISGKLIYTVLPVNKSDHFNTKVFAYQSIGYVISSLLNR